MDKENNENPKEKTKTFLNLFKKKKKKNTPENEKNENKENLNNETSQNVTDNLNTNSKELGKNNNENKENDTNVINKNSGSGVEHSININESWNTDKNSEIPSSPTCAKSNLTHNKSIEQKEKKKNTNNDKKKNNAKNDKNKINEKICNSSDPSNIALGESEEQSSCIEYNNIEKNQNKKKTKGRGKNDKNEQNSNSETNTIKDSNIKNVKNNSNQTHPENRNNKNKQKNENENNQNNNDDHKNKQDKIADKPENSNTINNENTKGKKHKKGAKTNEHNLNSPLSASPKSNNDYNYTKNKNEIVNTNMNKKGENTKGNNDKNIKKKESNKTNIEKNHNKENGIKIANVQKEAGGRQTSEKETHTEKKKKKKNNNENKMNISSNRVETNGKKENPSDIENNEDLSLEEILYETTERSKIYNRKNYGILGILKSIKASDSHLNKLSLGTDLTTLGLNLNSPDFIFPSFTSPISDNPTMKDDYFVRPESYMNTQFQVRLSLLLKLQTETLFYIFYNLPRDILQVYAASELYIRKWLYHIRYKKWFTPNTTNNLTQIEKCSSWIYFDPSAWSKKNYNNFLNPKDIMNVDEITKSIEEIIKIQSYYNNIQQNNSTNIPPAYEPQASNINIPNSP
ncbi:CCR4-NOT transcription complex subunit 2, putative [Plasmodium vinckei]|uniref:CCR4-NOT transcription complex subunit 2, putative n=1 Tax=Plasmodium vinckei TaxID=5860 RepID=A0A6V7SZI6_PLAVN|nr:CCR4-NOT transcription complex subunit 2, putative [Plasmodium vinckei]